MHQYFYISGVEPTQDVFKKLKSLKISPLKYTVEEAKNYGKAPALNEEEYKLDKALIKKIQTAIDQTWDYIGSDAMEVGVSTNEEALEMVLDASRMSHNFPEEDKIVDQVVAKFKWPKVLKFLAKNIRLL
jgi:hypothetical protein